MKPRLASEWLHSCAGCEIALVDLGEGLLELLARVEIVHFPLLMDQKYAGRAGEGDGPELPAADLGLVSGGVASEEQRAILLAMRRSCRTRTCSCTRCCSRSCRCSCTRCRCCRRHNTR